MNIDFFINVIDKKTLKVYDISDTTMSLPAEIHTMTLDIFSSKLPNGKIPNKLDVINYIRMHRVQNELFTVTSDVLGLAADLPIPDGVYHYYYALNNSIIREHTFLFYATVEEEINKLVKEVNYNVEIGDYDYEFVGDYSQDDLERIRLAVSLFNEIESIAQAPDEVKANDTLDKLQRLLEIIKQK